MCSVGMRIQPTLHSDGTSGVTGVLERCRYENTTCRRLLVTHADGTTSVEEIDNDADISKNDLVQMKASLRESGLEVIKIVLYGDLSDEGACMTTSPRKKPLAAVPQDSDSDKAAHGYKTRMSQSSVTFA